MNKYARSAVLSLALVGAWGCNDFLSGPGLTENPNSPLQALASQELVAVQANMFARMEGQIARCAAIFTQQLMGSNNQQLSYCTQYSITELDISGHMSAFFTGGGLRGMRSVQAAAVASGDKMIEGMALFWEALAMGMAASVWGDLPYSEAANPEIEAPALDSQQSIYTAVLARLDQAIAAFNAAPTAGSCLPADGDLIYCPSGGAVARTLERDRWIRAANTLKARYHLHLVERQGNAAYTAALAAATNGINEAPTTAAQAIHGQAPGDFRALHGSVQDVDANIWHSFLQARGGDIAAGHFMIALLKSRSDPRLSAYFDPNAQGEFVGRNENNVNQPPPGCASPCASSVVNTSVRRVANFRQPILTWAENELILAESKFVLQGAGAALPHVNAVRTAVGLGALGAVTLQDVMIEKYIAQFQNIDVWNDYKRTCIPQVTPGNNAPEVPGRLPYGAAERSDNPNIPLPSVFPTGTTAVSPLRNWNDPNAC